MNSNNPISKKRGRLERLPKSVKRFSDKRHGENNELEHGSHLRIATDALEKSLYSRREVKEIFHRFSLANPNPKSELRYNNIFTLLVAVVLSAQATDIGVNKATKTLFEIADTPQKMLALGQENLSEHIRTIGLWRAKAKNVIALSKTLVEQFNSCVPASREALMSLPGVGRKTANVVLNIAFQQPTMAVDTHIFRLANRLKLAAGKTPQEVEENLLRIIPSPYLNHAHHWLILHGRYICKARKPACPACLIADLCKSSERTLEKGWGEISDNISSPL